MAIQTRTGAERQRDRRLAELERQRLALLLQMEREREVVPSAPPAAHRITAHTVSRLTRPPRPLL